MRAYVVLVASMFLFRCGSEGGTLNWQANLQMVQPGEIISLNPLPVITVQGRNANEFELVINATSASANIPFELRGIPRNQALTFEVSGASLETVLSFPIVTGDDNPSLPALVGGTIGVFIDLAEDDDGINIDVNTSLGIVAGVIAASFSDEVVSTTGGSVASVRMVQKNNDTEVSYQGPFYFNSTGNLVDSGGCPDAECNYIFFDVPEGLYRFQRLGASDNVISEQDVVVLASQLTFGMQ